MRPWLAALLLTWAATAQAHEIHSTIAAADAVVVSLAYADGQPFAYEKYELTPAGQQVPAQVGNTDFRGRVAFVPGEVKNWRLRAFSADGHGVDLRFEAPVISQAPAAPATAASDRLTQILVGLSLLFGLFGLIQLFLRKKRP